MFPENEDIISIEERASMESDENKDGLCDALL